MKRLSRFRKDGRFLGDLERVRPNKTLSSEEDMPFRFLPLQRLPLPRALPPLTIRRTHPERFYSFWALGLHGLSYVGLLPVSTWWIAVATGAGSIAHSCTWNRKYYDLRYDLLLHWSPFLWVGPDWDPRGFGLLLLTLMFYVTYHGGIDNVLEFYRDALRAYKEEDYLVHRALDAVATQEDIDDAWMDDLAP